MAHILVYNIGYVVNPNLT